MKKTMLSKLAALLPAVVAATVLVAGSAEAVLRDFGPSTFAGYPVWYRDTTGTVVRQCLSKSLSPVSGLGLCNILPFPGTTPPFDPAKPLTFYPNPPTNYNWPLETFYFSAIAPPAFQFVQPGSKVLVETALEGTFAGLNPLPGDQIAFSRIRINLLGVPDGTYTVTHPFGVDTLTVTGGTKKMTRDIGAAGTPFVGSLQGDVGPFLRWTPDGSTNPDGTISAVNPDTGVTEKFLGDPNVPHTFTGSQFQTNYFRIDGPAGSGIGGPGIDFIQTNLALIEGQLFTDPIPTPLLVDRVTYARDAVSGQVDVYAGSDITSNQNTPSTLSIAGTDLATTVMTGNGEGRFFAHIPTATPNLIPATLTVTNTADNPPTTATVSVVDEVVITGAVYDPVARSLTVRAESADTLLNPQLTAVGLGLLDPNTGALVLPALDVPPPTVTVVSAGHGSATAPVSVRGNASPTAVNDNASVPPAGAVTIVVLANDSDPDGVLDPATVTIVTPPVAGAAAVNPDGTITYTAGPDPGSAAFTYTVKDNRGAVSNAATVTVSISATNIAPVAVNDNAATLAATPVVIPVLVNDSDPDGTLNPASVAIVAAALHGTAAANPDGTVTYISNVGYAGTDTFRYVVLDNLGGVSNSALVTVTVSLPNVPPVAANDSATTNKNAAVAINVLANDTDADGSINPASVLIVSQPAGGTAVAAVNGIVTFTPNLNFSGTTTFTYSVRDNLNAVSNVATVTVTVVNVNIPPVAVNDSATLVNGNLATVAINVLANDGDVDGTLDPATVTIGAPPANGSATVTGGGTVTYAPNPGFVGTNTFTYTVRDNAGAASNAATVTVTVTAPIAETLSVTRAQFTLNGRSWRVDGTTTARIPGETMTVYVGPTVAGGVLLGSAPVDPNGVWTFQLRNSVLGPDGTRTVSIRSSNGRLLEGVSVLVR